jgi:hypothetical protein
MTIMAGNLYQSKIYLMLITLGVSANALKKDAML